MSGVCDIAYHGYSQQDNKVVETYVKENLDVIHIYVPKGTKQVWKDAAAGRNLSLSRFIEKAVNYYMSHEDKPED